MGCSRLPLPSLLGLFGALLMELLTVTAVDLYDVPVDNPEVKKALAFAVEQYNQDKEDSANYFKLLSIQDIKGQLIEPIEFQAWVELVKTTCKKIIGEIKKYEKIQECEQLPGNHKKPNCFFAVRAVNMQFKMDLETTVCI